jgi:hypothetical protein
MTRDFKSSTISTPRLTRPSLLEQSAVRGGRSTRDRGEKVFTTARSPLRVLKASSICAPPNPAPLAAAGVRGELLLWLACGKRSKKERNTPKFFLA